MEFYFLLLSTIFTVARCQDIFTILPTTQYVWINQTATFECATNNSQYTLGFDIPDVIEQPVVEILPGGGQRIVATFTATSDVNGSSVECGAFDGFTLVGATDVVYVYIQAVPPVNNFMSKQQECGIFSSWKSQYLLPGLSVSYRVSINGEILQDNISTTNYTYYPMKLTNATYELAASAFDGSVVGDASIATVSFIIGSSITYNQGATRRLENDTWFYQLEIPVSVICLSNITEIQLQCCYSPAGASICYNASMTNNEVVSYSLGERYYIEAYVEIPVSTMLLTSATIEYASRQIYTTNEVITSSFNLQSMVLLNVTNQALCLRLQLVNGTSVHTVFLYAVNDDESIDDYTLGDASTTAQQLSYDVCYSMPAGIWTVYACDGPAPANTNTCTSPAASLPVAITSIRTSTTVMPTIIISTSRAVPTASINAPERTTSPTYSTTTSRGVGESLTPTVIVRATTTGSVAPIIAVVVVLLVLAIVVAIVAVITVLLYRRSKTGSLSFTFKHSSSYNLDSPRSTVQVTLVPLEPEEHRYEITSTDGTINSIDGTINSNNGTINSNNGTIRSTASQGKPLLYADIEQFIGKKDVTPEPPTQYAEIVGTVYKPFPASLSSKTQDVAPTQTELQDVLVPRLSRLWFTIGMELGLNSDQLEEVQGNRLDDDGCFKDVLMMWEDNATVDKPYTWTTMLNVLRSTRIGEERLANLLSSRFKQYYY